MPASPPTSGKRAGSTAGWFALAWASKISTTCATTSSERVPERVSRNSERIPEHDPDRVAAPGDQPARVAPLPGRDGSARTDALKNLRVLHFRLGANLCHVPRYGGRTQGGSLSYLTIGLALPTAHHGAA